MGEKDGNKRGKVRVVYGERELLECLKNVLRCRDRQRKECLYEREESGALLKAFEGR